MKCREVRRFVQTTPKGDHQKTLSRIAAHLSECEECREWHADFQRMERALERRKLQLDAITVQIPLRRSQVFSQIVRAPQRKRSWFLRHAWVPAAMLALVAAGVAAFLLSGRATNSPGNAGAPMKATTMTEALPSATLEQLAELLHRHEAPSSALPYAPDAFEHEPFYPSMLQYLEPEDTLTTLAKTTINMTRRDET